MSTTAGGNGKQPSLLSAMASLFRDKRGSSTRLTGGVSSSRSVSSAQQSETLPRSYGINRTNSERSEGAAGLSNKASEANGR